MRALVVSPGPAFSVADVHRGWVKGLRQVGVEVADFELGDRLSFFWEALVERDGQIGRAFSDHDAARLAVREVEAACYEWWPDLVVVISGFFLNEFVCEVIRARGHKLALVHTESPYEEPTQLARASWVDVNVVNDPTNIGDYPPGTIYLPHCYDPEVHYPANATPTADVCFVGTGYPSRVEFLEAVDWSGLTVKLAGHWQDLGDDSPLRPFLIDEPDECCDNTDTADLYRSSKLSFNLYRTETVPEATSDGWAMGPREVELAACRVPFLRQSRPEGDELFPMLPTFSTPRELETGLRWWLSHPGEAEAAASKACEAVGDRTFDRNAGRLLDLINT